MAEPHRRKTTGNLEMCHPPKTLSREDEGTAIESNSIRNQTCTVDGLYCGKNRSFVLQANGLTMGIDGSSFERPAFCQRG